MSETYAVVLKDSNGAFPIVYEGPKELVMAWLKNQKDVSLYEIYSGKTKTIYSITEIIAPQSEPILPEYYQYLVPKFYKMNPETDDLLPSSDHLANGMVVLMASSKHRMVVGDNWSDWQEDRALENNRWCTVESFRVTDTHVSFVGVYEDGTKMMRCVLVGEAWFVKIDSIRASENLRTDRFVEVCSAVHEALREASEEDPMDVSFKDTPELDEIAEKTTKHILGLL